MTGKQHEQNFSHPQHVDSYYAASVGEIPSHVKLSDDINVDVCVIGGGYTGVSTALHLASRGYQVAVLEAERLGWGASGRNGGHVGTGQCKDQFVLEKMLGDRHARALWDLSLESVQLVKDLIKDHHVDCDLKHGSLHLARKASDVPELVEEASHMNNKYGYDSVRVVDQQEARAMIDSDLFFGGLLDTQSAHLHPLKYLLGLVRAAQKNGVQMYENSRVLSYTKGKQFVAKTATGEVRARFGVIACNGYIEKLVPEMAGKIMPINNFILATEPLSEDLARRVIRDDVAVTDSLFVINYWKLTGDNRLLFGGGENYSRRFPKDIKKFVRKYMLRIYPQLEDVTIEYGWGGTLAITLKRMPHYGQLSPNLFFAQGYSGHGVPTATMAGKLLAEAIDGNDTRFQLMATVPTPNFPGGTLLRWPGLVAGMSYYALRDRW